MKRHWFLWLLLILLAVIAWASSPVGTCTGDLSGDRAVNGADLSVLLAQFGDRNDCTPSAAALAIEDPEEREAVCDIECMQSRPRADINGDGVVDGLDLTILLGNWECCEWEVPGVRR